MMLDGDSSAVALHKHLDDILAQHSKVSTHIEGIEAKRAQTAKELEDAKARLADIQECKVDKDIGDCQGELEEEKAEQSKLSQEIKDCEAELGDHKAQLAKSLDKMAKMSKEMHEHNKSKDDHPAHTTKLEEGVNVIDEHLSAAKALVAKRQQQHRAQADYNASKVRDEACRSKLQEFQTQKRNEEDEAKRLEGNFSDLETKLADLDAQIEQAYKDKAELDAIIDETKTAHSRILASCEALNDVLKRETVLLNRQAKCTKQLPPNMMEDAKKLMAEFSKQLEEEGIERERAAEEEKARLKYLAENPPPPEPEPRAKGKAKAKAKR